MALETGRDHRAPQKGVRVMVRRKIKRRRMMTEQVKPEGVARQLYRRATVAKILDCHVHLLRRLEIDGRLHPVKLRTHVFYKCEEVHRLVQGEDERDDG